MQRPTFLSPILFIALLGGCSSRPVENASLLSSLEISAVTQVELRERLRDFASRLSYAVKGAASDIVAVCPDQSIRKRTVYWKLFTIPLCRKAVYQQAPVASLIDLWSFCAQMRQFFESGDGREAFGEWTPIATSASTELEEDITRIATEIIAADLFPKARAAVDEFVERHPIRGRFARYSARPVMVRASDAKSLQWIVDMPLAPFRMFMSEHARSIQELAQVADKFIDFATDEPEIARWQLDLLLYDLEDRDSTLSALESFKTLSTSAHMFAETAKNLPEELRTQLTATLDDVESKQAGFRETLKEARTTFAKLDESLESAGTIAASIERSTQNWLEAGVKWDTAVHAFDDMVQGFSSDSETSNGAAAPEEDDSFDIKDYTRTADTTQAAAGEIRALTDEVRQLLDSGAVESFAWKIAWIGVVLIIAFFVSMLGYRIASMRFTPRRSSR